MRGFGKRYRIFLARTETVSYIRLSMFIKFVYCVEMVKDTTIVATECE